MYYKCHKVNFRHGGSYIDSLNWIKKKKVTNDKRFQHTATVSLNYGETELHPSINEYK